MTNKRSVTLAVLFTLVAAAGLYGAGHYTRQYLADNNKSGVVTCGGKHQSLVVTIKNDVASPATTAGMLCDTLTITNQDPIDREVAFGPHEDHIPYDGVAERLLEQGQSLTITLNQVGTYHFHDHIHDEVQGYFTVQK